MIDILKLSEVESVSMHDDWFDIADEKHFWMQWRLKAILKQSNFLPNQGSNLLEVGCGNGIVVNQLEEELNYTIDGCDLNLFAIEKSKPSKGLKMLYNIFDLKQDLLNKYDGGILLDVLEHIKDDVEFLRTSAKYVKRNGIIIINTPALQTLYSNYDKEVGHVRRYNKESMMKLINNAGLEPLKISYWGMTLLPIAILRKRLIANKKSDIIKTGFKPAGKIQDFILRMLMNIENAFPWNPPIGTSLVAICKVK
jgi:SAM-dependent methyltransferase